MKMKAKTPDFDSKDLEDFNGPELMEIQEIGTLLLNDETRIRAIRERIEQETEGLLSEMEEIEKHADSLKKSLRERLMQRRPNGGAAFRLGALKVRLNSTTTEYRTSPEHIDEEWAAILSEIDVDGRSLLIWDIDKRVLPEAIRRELVDLKALTDAGIVTSTQRLPALVASFPKRMK